jgi:protocatechuate 3,4-dioxygenase beta subunit
MTRSDHGLTRRGALRGLGGAGLGLAGLGLFGPKDFEDEAYSATPSCTLVAEQEEGPYYLDLDKVRKNITEGKSGVRLDLRIKIVDSTSCDPLKDVAVDIWHCAANGKYSGFSAEGTSGETFLRGIQLTDEDGIAAFRTIYPGWYQGRTVHIHTMVHIGGNVVHTGQLYFSDAVTDAVYRRSPYSSRPNRNPRNSGDSIYRNGGKRSTLKLVKSGAAYTGSITMGVQRS